MKKRDLQKNIKKNLIIVLNYSLNHRLFFRVLGFINKKLLKGKIKSVFLVYPAKKKYITDFTYNWFSKKMKWRPFPIGFFVQKKKVGIVFTVSAEEEDLLDDKNRDKLRLLVERMEEKRKLLNSEMKSFAGILPGVLAKKNILKMKSEDDSTVIAVFRAVQALGEKENLPPGFPLVVLGGKGFVGKRLIAFLKKKEEKSPFSRDVFAVDVDNFSQMSQILKSIGDKSVVFLNITKKKALNEYIKFFNKKTVVLNEVYPEPSAEELAKIKEKKASCYHIVGLRGNVYPPFPGAYRQGVPCCASFVSCEKDDIIIKKLI